MLLMIAAIKKLSLAVLLLVGTAFGGQNAGIAWFKDLERATEAAKKTNQPMMIVFWADWCAACKVMDAEIYHDPRVVAAVNAKLVTVRIHFDLQKDLVQKYNVPALPYLVFTNSNGMELMHHRGSLDANELAAVIQALPADVSLLNRLDSRLRNSRDDFESLVSMGRELRTAGFFLTSNEYYARAIKQKDARRDPEKREVILVEMGLNFLDLRNAKLAVRAFETCLQEFSTSSRTPDLLLNLARSYILGDHKAEARRSLENLIDSFPQSEASRKAAVMVKSL